MSIICHKEFDLHINPNLFQYIVWYDVHSSSTPPGFASAGANGPVASIVTSCGTTDMTHANGGSGSCYGTFELVNPYDAQPSSLTVGVTTTPDRYRPSMAAYMYDEVNLILICNLLDWTSNTHVFPFTIASGYNRFTLHFQASIHDWEAGVSEVSASFSYI